MEKIKHIVLAGIVIVSMVMFGVVYYMKTTDAGWENIRSFVLADSGSEDDEEEEEDEKESDDEEEDDEDEEEDEKKVRKESSKSKSSNSGSEKSDSVSRSKNTGSTNTTRVEKIKIKEDDEDEDDEGEEDEEDDEGESDDGENEDDDDEEEIEDDEDEEEGEGTIVSKEVITNDDGTVTRRTTILKKDGRKKVTEHTFDANNKLLSKKKSEVRNDKGEEKVEVESFDVYGKKISEYKMETEDGKKIEIRRKNALGESKLKFNAEKQELMVRVKEGEQNEAKAFLRVKADENSTKIKLTRAGIIANSNFPITVDDETGKIYVKTPFKEVELKQMPDVIVEKAKQAKELDIVDGATLENDARPSYILKGKKFEKFLGFYTVEIPSEIIYDADTGEKISANIPGLKKLLSWFSF